MSAAFQVSDVERLLAVMEQWGIAELHLQVEDARLDLVRAIPAMTTPQAAMPEAPIGISQPAAPSVEAPVGPALVTIFAPAVGLFHLASRGFPHNIPQPGDAVQAGQRLGTIELMHIPSELVSPVSGIIEGILAEDGAGVEYGQPLMVIQPYEEVCEDEAGLLPPR